MEQLMAVPVHVHGIAHYGVSGSCAGRSTVAVRFSPHSDWMANARQIRVVPPSDLYHHMYRRAATAGLSTRLPALLERNRYVEGQRKRSNIVERKTRYDEPRHLPRNRRFLFFTTFRPNERPPDFLG